MFDIHKPDRGENIRTIMPKYDNPPSADYRTKPKKITTDEGGTGAGTGEQDAEEEVQYDSFDALADFDVGGAGTSKFRKPGLYLTYKKKDVGSYGDLRVSVSWHEKVYQGGGSWKKNVEKEFLAK